MTTAFSRAAGAIAVVLLLPAVVLADGGAGQKSVIEPNLVNSIVTLFVFGALLAILYTFAWGPILKGLQAREDAQFQALNDAKKAKEEAAALRSQLQAEMAKAAEQVRSIMDDARKDAEALRVAEREAGVKDAEAERERAKREIAAKQESMTKEVQAQAVQLAVLIASKAIRQQVTVQNQTELLDESIAELKTNASRA